MTLKATTSKAVCFGITSRSPIGDDRYFRQLKVSLPTLRRYNATVKIYVFVYGALPKIVNDMLRTYDVEIQQRPAIHNLYPYMVKWMTLNEMPEERVLFLDADTLIGDDIEILFERYRKFDFYARREFSSIQRSYWIGKQWMEPQIDHKTLHSLYSKAAPKPIPIFNAGVMLFNNSFHKRLRFTRIRHHLDRLIKGKIPYPSNNPHIRGEISLALTLSEFKDFTWGFFPKETAPYFIEMQEREVKTPGVVLHVTTDLYKEFLNYKKLVSYMPAGL